MVIYLYVTTFQDAHFVLYKAEDIAATDPFPNHSRKVVGIIR